MWERIKPVVDGSIIVSLQETKDAMRLMAEKARIISEGAGALPLAAALTGKAGQGPIVAIVSGGNIDLAKFAELIGRAMTDLENGVEPIGFFANTARSLLSWINEEKPEIVSKPRPRGRPVSSSASISE